MKGGNMFNFTKDASQTKVASVSGFSLNTSLPRWGLLFDTGGYFLVYAS
jgi:hypothetical protein